MAESPKRRKCKDNPYTLNYIEEKNIYTITFKDVKGHLNKVEVVRKYIEFLISLNYKILKN